MSISLLQIDEPGRAQRFPLWELGFRPFFLLASLYAVLAVGLWMGVYFAQWPLVVQGLPVSYWHAHEMLFGYGMAVVAGFLLTVVKNWTGIQTLQNGRLAGLVALWLAGRVLFLAQAPWWLAMAVELLFVLGLLLASAGPLWQARQWRNLSIFASKVALLGIANLLFYLGMAGLLGDGLRLGIYSALYLLAALIFTMARRVVPFFIEKGIGYALQLRNSKLADLTSLVGLLGLWLAELIVPASAWTIGFALLTAMVQLVRLYWWYAPGMWRKPLIWVLWSALAWVTLGLLLKALAEWRGLPVFAAWHAIAYGGVGMITIGMMARASLGHTGRNVLDPPPLLGWLFALLMVGAALRSLLPMLVPAWHAQAVVASQLIWMAVFTLFFLYYLPIWTRPALRR